MAKAKPSTGSKRSSTYNRKRRFDETPEPAASFSGDVDPGKARPGETFVIHQHHATRLHFDLRLEMLNGKTPVLASWAVPKGLPRRKGKGALAIHVEDHPFEYGSFQGSIPEGNYGAGAVRIFDSGTYEMLDQKDGNIRFRLEGHRLQGVYRLVRTRMEGGKEQWLVFLSKDERPEPEPLPPLNPMLATLITRPFDDDEWAFEPKWDGIRALSVCDEETKLVSRNDRDVTVAYPELHEMHKQLVALDAIVDGEIVAFEDGVPSFQKLQSRMHVRGAHDISRLMKTIPVAYIAFDLIYLDGRDLRELSYSERRELLDQSVVATRWFQLSPFVQGDGRPLFEAASAQGLEGVVGKRLSSRYESGQRSKNWLKIKTTFDADVVIAGWNEGGSGGLRSLVTAVYDGDRLRSTGTVGTGFDVRSREMLEGMLRPLETDEVPFSQAELKGKPELRHAHWVRPELVATVEFRQLTAAGKLRAPSFKGLREDLDPRECTFAKLRDSAGS
ncbi:MAG: non-homologous end-joining DNA ligase [Actinomycetota bacterium]